MSSLGRSFGVVGAVFTMLLLGSTASAYADGLQECIDQAESHGGVPPTCTEVNGGWEASWPDDGLGGVGSGGFAFVFVLVALIGIAMVVWKVSTARKLASQSGMDPDLATQMTLLTDNGLDATYLAASLRNPSAASAVPATTPAAERLAELKGLLDSGLITQEEYDKRRTAIIDAV